MSKYESLSFELLKGIFEKENIDKTSKSGISESNDTYEIANFECLFWIFKRQVMVSKGFFHL